MDLTSDKLREVMAGVPDADAANQTLAALAAKGYTVNGKPIPVPNGGQPQQPIAQAAPQRSGPSLNPFQPVSDMLPSSQPMPPGGELREADPMEKFGLLLPQALTKESGFLNPAADIATQGGPGAAVGIENKERELMDRFNSIFNPKTGIPLGGKTVPLTPAELTQKPAFAALEKMLGNVPFASGIMKRFQDLRVAALNEHRASLLEKAGAKMGAEQLGEQTGGVVGKAMTGLSDYRTAQRTGQRGELLGTIGVETTPLDAGAGVQSSLDAAKQSVKGKASSLYEDASKAMPPELSNFDANELREKASEILAQKGKSGQTTTVLQRGPGLQLDPVKKTVGQSISTLPSGLESELKDIVSGTGDISWDKLHDLQSDWGTTANAIKKQNNGFQTVEGKIYKDLQSAARGAMDRRAAEIGGDFGEKYDIAKNFYKDYRTTFDNDAIKKVVRARPDQIFGSLVQRGSVEDLQKLKKIVGDEGLQPMRRLFVEDILGGAGSEIPTGDEIAKKLADYKYKLPDLLNAGQLEQVKQFAKTGELPQFLQNGLEKQLVSMSKKNPTAIVDTVMRGDPTVTRAVKNIVGPQGWQPYRRELMERVIGEAGENIFSSDKMAKALDGMHPEYRSLFFNDSELQQIKQLGDVKRKMETGEKLWGNPSGTAKNVIAWEFGKLMLKNPLTGAASALPPPLLAKFYLSSTGRRILVDGLNASEKTAALNFTRASAFAVQAKRELMDEQRQKMGLPPVFSQ